MRNTKHIFVALLACFISLVVPQIHAQKGFVHRQGKLIVDGQGAPLHLRGINLGNWLVPEGYMFKFDKEPQAPHEIEDLTKSLLGPAEAEHFWHTYRLNYISREDIQFLKKANFNSIRIPLHYKFFLPGTDEGFALLDPVVQWASEAGLYVVLDMHCAPGGQTGANIDDSWGYPWLFESQESQQQLIDIWKRIARHYRDNRMVLGYDLLNEPLPHFEGLDKYRDKLEPLYRRVTAGIRSVDPNHVIILGGAVWDSDFSVFGEPFDKNVLYTFHKYWVAPTQQSIQQYLDFGEKYQVPIWLGESGENNTEWIATFAALLDKNDIGWAFWPYKKMDSDSSIMRFTPPTGWGGIVIYAKQPWTTNKVEEALKSRPANELVKNAFAELLEKIRFQNCLPNEAYIRALGGTLPPTKP
jgi:Cellulase (glycosyl hydrolase family 5)